MRIRTLLTASLLAALPLSGALAKDAALAKAVADPNRTPTLVARDSYRHPQEVLEFAGIAPTMTVVEVSPGGGYWTEILGPYLKDKGTYYTALAPRGASAV
jgi:predicted methyltransferase